MHRKFFLYLLLASASASAARGLTLFPQAEPEQAKSSDKSSGSQPSPTIGSAAQQSKDPSSKPAPAPANQPPASDLSQDLSFPGDAGKPAADTPPSASPAPSKSPAPDLAPPRSDRVRANDLPADVGESSSKESQTDLTAPEDDEKAHPKSSTVVSEAEAGISQNGVSEFKTWNPQKAAKDIEVGDFYYKRKNYKAAEERYREALTFKENDAQATIKLADCLEKLGVLDDARAEYESYLKILPYGPEAGQAHKALERLSNSSGKAQ